LRYEEPVGSPQSIPLASTIVISSAINARATAKNPFWIGRLNNKVVSLKAPFSVTGALAASMTSVIVMISGVYHITTDDSLLCEFSI
jgi:hypothetical protein